MAQFNDVLYDRLYDMIANARADAQGNKIKDFVDSPKYIERLVNKIITLIRK